MSVWSEEVLLIQYAALGSNPGWRLRVLSTIGVLLNKPTGFYTPAMLGLLPVEWHRLRTWIEQGHGSQFWRLESHGVHVIRSCEKHILIGTNQLLADLRNVIRKPLSIQQPRLDEKIWVAIRRYATMEITHEAD